MNTIMNKPMQQL